MKRILLLLLVLIPLAALSGKVTLITNRGSDLIVEYTLDPWKVVPEGEFTRIVAKELDFKTNSGAPLIPYDNFKLGIPPNGDFSFSILESETEAVALNSRIIPVPTITMKDGMSNYKNIPDASLYVPAAPEVVQAAPFSFRGYSLASFTVNPFVYDGQKGLTVYTRLLIRIELQGQLSYRSAIPGDTITEVMLGQILNPEQARNWRSNTRAPVNYADFGLSDYWIRIETNRDGMHRLNYAQLSGFPLADVDPRTFRLFSTSGVVMSRAVVQAGPEFKEVPILVSNEASGVFGAGDYILFYGSSRDGYAANHDVQIDATYMNPYSQNQVFWLSFGNNFSGTPLRITSTNPETAYTQALNNTPSVKHYESETQRREDTGFTWYENRFFGNTSASYALPVELADVDTTGTQNLTFRIRQEDVISELTHRISVDVNGVLVKNNVNTGTTEFNWVGNAFYTFNKSFKGFVSGSNSLKLNVMRSEPDNLYFDWYRIAYRQNLFKGTTQKVALHQQAIVPTAYRYNLTGSLSNLMIFRANGLYDVQHIPLQGSYFVSSGTSSTSYFLLSPSEAYTPVSVAYTEPTDLIADAGSIDNMIITTSEFLTKAQSLAQKYHDTYALQSRVVLQDDIFNQFNGGHPDPAAIRQAIRYFYHNLPAPNISSVTLIGLGTMDWRNYSGAAAAKNKIMVWQQEDTVSDDYFAMITRDWYPEVAIGRYPVHNAIEMDNMMQNFSSYTESPTPGWWRNSMVFVGDDLNNGDTVGEDIHTLQAEQAGNKVHDSILADKIFAWEYEYDEFQNKPRVRSDMFAAINEGRLLWCYIGHGSYDQLGAEDYLNGAVDMGRFANSGKLPFFIASSCKVSHFDHWGYDSLGQKTVLMNNLGAIASFGATRVSYPGSNQELLLWLLEYIANQRYSLGAAIIGAKFRSPNWVNNSVYVLLGDPVLRVVPPERSSNMQVSAQPEKGLLHSRDTAAVDGTFSATGLTGEAQLKAFNTETAYQLGALTVSHRGAQLYTGSVDVSASVLHTGFIVPDDVSSGNTGLVVSYYWDAATKKDYTTYLYPLQLSDQALPGHTDNASGPEIKIYLGSYDFRDGDIVSTSPLLYAQISDPNGINITGANGHNIFLVLDNSLQPIPITSYFNYEKGSYVSGTLTYQLSSLSEGMHTLQLIAFDNYNLPSVTTVSFNAVQSSELSIERLLAYPNPMSSNGYLTFILSSDAEVNIGVYTIRGKRIKNIKATGKQGFNSIAFEARDDKGSPLANNTYFVKVKAQSPSGNSVEKTEKLVIFK